jgi:hypothetical protein
VDTELRNGQHSAPLDPLDPDATWLTVFRIVDGIGVWYTTADFRDGRDAIEAALARAHEAGQLGPTYPGLAAVDSYAVMDVIGSDGFSIIQDYNIPVATFMTTFALEQAIRQVDGQDPQAILRLVVCDPACGCGVFLVEAARLLAANYAGRLFGGQPTPAQVFAVMPTVVLWSVFGIDIDPVAAELARVAVSLETGGTIPPEALARHIVAGNPLDGDSPPAMEARR